MEYGCAQQKQIVCGPWVVVATQLRNWAGGYDGWTVNAYHEGGGKIFEGENRHADPGPEMTRLARLIDWKVGVCIHPL